MMSEPTLTRIRKARQRISAECGHDPYKLVDYYMKLQKESQHKLVPPIKSEKMSNVLPTTQE